MYVSPDNAGTIEINGQTVSSFPISFGTNSSVLIEAVPTDNYEFSEWSGDLTGANNPSIIVMSCDKYITANFKAMPGAVTRIYYPHVASGNQWETEITLINTHAQTTLTGTFLAYDDQGNLVDQRAGVSLSPNARIELTVGRDFLNPGNIGYVVFEANAENSNYMAGYAKFFIAGKYRVAIPAEKTVNTGDIYIPHIASNATWWTGISLVNTGITPKTLTIDFDSGDSRQVTLGAGDHRAILISDLFNGSVPDIHAAIIRDAADVIGLELFGGGNRLSGVPLNGNTSRTLYYPHVAENATWWTGIVAFNPSLDPTALTIRPYDANGSALATRTIDLGGFANRVDTSTGLNLPADTAWFKVTTGGSITGFALFGTSDGNQLAGYTAVGINKTSGVFAKLEQAGWTGVAFVNAENSNNTVTLNAYDDNGVSIASASMTLGPYEKVIGIAESLFEDGISGATYIRYSATGKVVGFQLNGSADGQMLDSMPGM